MWSEMGMKSRVLVVLATLLVVENVLAYVLLHQAFPWMTMFPDDHPHAAQANPAPVKPVSIHTPGPVPAQLVVHRVVWSDPPMFASRWAATAPQPGVPAWPLAAACGPPNGPSPVVAASRGWARGSGAGVNDTWVNLSVQAYGAGEGALALKRISQQLRSCGSVSNPPMLGVEAVRGDTSQGSMVAWRRGDVVVLGTVRHGSLDEFKQVWRRTDRHLDAALTGVCLDQQSTMADVVRSPYAGRRQFKGLGDTPTIIPAPSTAPSPLPSPAPGGPTPSEVPIPAPTIPAPALSIPARPSDPVQPAGLPAPVPQPDMPTAPTQPPGQLAVYHRIPDPRGPGCGWAFTRQRGPAYDAQQAQRNYQAEQVAARNRLQAQWTQWQRDRVSYFVAYAEYAQAMGAYSQYAAEVAAVAAQWNRVWGIRNAYESALASWKAAVDARSSFYAAQNAAAQQYQAALAKCQQSGHRQSQSAQQGNAQRQSKKKPPKPNPKPPPKPAPKPPPKPACPPPRPAILSQQAPGVPPEPAAPDASFPEWSNPGHLLRYP